MAAGFYKDPKDDRWHKCLWVKVLNMSTKVKPYFECYCGRKKDI